MTEEKIDLGDTYQKKKLTDEQKNELKIKMKEVKEIYEFYKNAKKTDNKFCQMNEEEKYNFLYEQFPDFVKNHMPVISMMTNNDLFDMRAFIRWKAELMTSIIFKNFDLWVELQSRYVIHLYQLHPIFKRYSKDDLNKIKEEIKEKIKNESDKAVKAKEVVKELNEQLEIQSVNEAQIGSMFSFIEKNLDKQIEEGKITKEEKMEKLKEYKNKSLKLIVEKTNSDFKNRKKDCEINNEDVTIFGSDTDDDL